MRVLLTGAAGFLGSHLMREFPDAIGVDRRDGDLSRYAAAGVIFSEHRPELVIHLAAHVGRQFCEDKPDRAILRNVVATLNVARWARLHGCAMVHFSTSEVYGSTDELLDEDAPLTAVPTGIYAQTKRWAEETVRSYGPEDLKIVRPSMPYGPGAPPGRGRRALDNMLWQAHHRMPIPVHRGAERSWCHVSDFTRAVRLIVEEGKPGAYNVGRDDDPMSMLELAERACDIAEAPRDLIELVDPPARQTVVKRLSTDKLRSLGWRPEVDIDEGLYEMYDWIQNFDEEGRWQPRSDTKSSAVAL